MGEVGFFFAFVLIPWLFFGIRDPFFFLFLTLLDLHLAKALIPLLDLSVCLGAVLEVD